jgi:hypothetical protein
MTKEKIVYRLKKMGAFWSYSPKGLSQIDDDIIIEEALKWGDVEEIKDVSDFYSLKRVKQVWEHRLAQDFSLYAHNYYLALIFFNMDSPEHFIKRKIKEQNGRFNRFTS